MTPTPDPSARAFSPPAAPLNRNLLALDLATRTGWAIAKRDGRVIGGTESFVPRASWDAGQRGLRFQAWLRDLCTRHDVHAIAYELVIRHGPQNMAATAHLYGLLEGLLWMTASPRQIPVAGVQPSVVKKLWTGSGRADKRDMITEAARRGFRVDDDNHADALGILAWALQQETGGCLTLGAGTVQQVAHTAAPPQTRITAPARRRQTRTQQEELLP